jgi:signal transduction histidine kinase
MMRWFMAGCGLLAAALLAWGGWSIHKVNERDTEREELILRLQAQRLARHVNADKPQYEAYLHRHLNSERTFMRLLLYDLSGWEIGRSANTRPPLELNEAAVRYAAGILLRPLNGERPLEPYVSDPPELLSETRLGNRLFATNVLVNTWLAEMKSTSGEWWMVATAPVFNFDPKVGRSFISAWIQTAIPLVEFERPARERWQLFALGAAAAVVLFGGVLWASFRQSRSLRALAVAAEAIPLDRLAVTRLPEPADVPEAKRLVTACNRLLEKVAEAHVAQQRFVADAAHELRTPLTILRGEIQVALREPKNHPFLIETLRSNLDEAVHLSRLVDSLLTLARADVGQALVRHDPVLMAPLIRTSLAKLETLAAQSGVRLEFETDENAESATVTGDAIALEQVIRNLVENAVQHSPRDHSVRVTLNASSNRVKMCVIDRGIGISPEHLGKLFDRFYRVDAARRRTDGGAGLGLAIVKTLVEAQGGSIVVQSEIGVGSVFTVELPLDSKAASG